MYANIIPTTKVERLLNVIPQSRVCEGSVRRPYSHHRGRESISDKPLTWEKTVQSSQAKEVIEVQETITNGKTTDSNKTKITT